MFKEFPENFEKIKKLGKGVQGTVYLIKYRTYYYTFKVQKIRPERIDIDVKRELDFYRDVANRYPDFFSMLYSYRVRGNTFETISDLKDGSLFDIYQDLKLCQWYSLYAQIAYAIHLMSKAKYLHNDLHSGNIMFTKTSKKTIELGSYSVPSNGLMWSIIDYGMVTKGNENDDELYFLKNTSSGYDDLEALCEKNAKICETMPESINFTRKVKKVIEWPLVQDIMKKWNTDEAESLGLLNFNLLVELVCGYNMVKKNIDLHSYLFREDFQYLLKPGLGYLNISKHFAKRTIDCMKN